MEQHPAYDSCFSTPCGSAPSSPGRAACFYYSAPASPTHFAISTAACRPRPSASGGGSASFEFDFPTAESMTSSADELFCNGQIRPMKLSAHLRLPQPLAPLTESDAEEGRETFARGRELKPRAGSLRGRTRSLSPLRTTPSENEEPLPGCDGAPPPPQPPCGSRSSSRRWVFLKEFLYRSKSEGGNNEGQNGKLRGSLSFSPAKDNKKATPQSNSGALNSNNHNNNNSDSKEGKLKKGVVNSKKEDGDGKRKGRSAHEVHYTAKRAQAEEMKKKTFLPYRQGLLGCLGFRYRSYGAINGFTTAFNSLPSR